MKNIHVIPTPNPSYLYKMSDGSLNISDLFEGGNSAWKNQNIYITNDEKPKEGDWVLVGYVLRHPDTKNKFNGDTNPIKKLITKGDLWEFNDGTNRYGSTCKKIILTTDQDLIKDGVQAIPDDFLEWFVKNSSCEFVIVELPKSRDNYISNEQYQKEHIWDTNIKIIIPTEEPKQIYYNTVGRENGVFVIKGQFNTQKEALDLSNELNEKGLGVYYDWNETLVKEEPKQGTLEEEMGKKVAEYCKQYAGTDKYDVAMLAIEFGYNLNLD